MNEPRKHWLVRPENIRKLWALFLLILAGTVVAETFVEAHPHFKLESTFGFNAWYGFATCVAMVIGAKVLGVFLKRPDRYYEGDGS